MNVNQPIPYTETNTLIGRNICLIVSLACLLGFLVDVAVISTPPDVLSLQWRINFCQQLSDRSILFLAGVALLLYGIFKERQLTKFLSRFCLIVGVIYLMSSIVVIRDTIAFKEHTFRELTTQKRELQLSIQSSKESGQLPAEITDSDVKQASDSISERAELIRRDTSRDIVKVGVASVGNLVATGLGLIGLSRIGIKRLNRYY